MKKADVWRCNIISLIIAVIVIIISVIIKIAFVLVNKISSNPTTAPPPFLHNLILF